MQWKSSTFPCGSPGCPLKARSRDDRVDRVTRELPVRCPGLGHRRRAGAQLIGGHRRRPSRWRGLPYPRQAAPSCPAGASNSAGDDVGDGVNDAHLLGVGATASARQASGGSGEAVTTATCAALLAAPLARLQRPVAVVAATSPRHGWGWRGWPRRAPPRLSHCAMASKETTSGVSRMMPATGNAPMNNVKSRCTSPKRTI